MSSIKEFKSKSIDELKVELIKLREDQFKLRMRKSTGQLGQVHLLKGNKKSIARIKTLMTEKAGK